MTEALATNNKRIDEMEGVAGSGERKPLAGFPAAFHSSIKFFVAERIKSK